MNSNKVLIEDYFKENDSNNNEKNEEEFEVLSKSMILSEMKTETLPKTETPIKVKDVETVQNQEKVIQTKDNIPEIHKPAVESLEIEKITSKVEIVNFEKYNFVDTLFPWNPTFNLIK